MMSMKRKPLYVDRNILLFEHVRLLNTYFIRSTFYPFFHGRAPGLVRCSRSAGTPDSPAERPEISAQTDIM